MAGGGRGLFLGFSCGLDRFAPIAIIGEQGKAILFCSLLFRPWSNRFLYCISLGCKGVKFQTTKLTKYTKDLSGLLVATFVFFVLLVVRNKGVTEY